jgi:hypothetical protein
VIIITIHVAIENLKWVFEKGKNRMKYSLICLCPQNKVGERNIYAKREGSESAIFRSGRGKSLFIDKEKP